MKTIAISLAAATLILTGSSAVRANPHFATTQFAGQVTTVSGAFQSVSAVTFDPDHQVFYAFAAGKINKITLAGVVSSLCRLNIPTAGGLAYDSANQLIYATDPQQFAVYSLSQDCTANLVAGGTRGTADGQGSAAQFQYPTGIALDPAHQILYVSDFDRVRAVTTAGAVTTFTAPGSIGQAGQFLFKTVGLSFDPSGGKLYVADEGREMIETINARGRVQSIAGRCVSLTSPECTPMQIDGPRVRAGFGSPSGVVFDSADGSLYTVEYDNNDIRRIAGNAVTTLAGSGILGNADGIGILASFYTPQGLALDPVSGTMLVADFGNGKLRLVTTQGATPPPPPHGTLGYDPPTYLSGPNSITVAADGTTWFTEGTGARIGRRTPDGAIHEFVLPRLRAQPANILIGPDGAVWFSDTGVYRGGRAAIARLSSTGIITEYPIGPIAPFQTAYVNGLVVGSDGNIWFTDTNDSIFGYVTPLGQVTQFPGGFAFIAAGYDGDIWLAQLSGVNPPQVYRYDTTGALLHTYQIFNSFGSIISFANGNNQAVWFTYDPGIVEVGELFADGKIQVVDIPRGSGCLPYGNAIAQGDDGDEWYAWAEVGCKQQHSAELAQVTPAGQTTLYPIYAARSGPSALTFAPDGTLWFADPSANKIGKLY